MNIFGETVHILFATLYYSGILCSIGKKKTDILYEEVFMSEINSSVKRALLDLCQEKGVLNVSVSDLTKRAYINRGTFYLHYENLDTLIREIEDDLLNNLKAASMSQPYSTGMNKYQWFYATLNSEVCQVKANYMWFSTLLGPKGDPSFKSKVYQYIKSSSFRKFDALCLPLDNNLLDYTINGSMGLFLCWINKGADLDPSVLTSLMLQTGQKHLTEQVS